MTFKFLEKEKFYLKSMRERVYMQRLVVQLLFVTIVVPALFNYILVRFSPPGFREIPSQETIDKATDVNTFSVSYTRTDKQQYFVDTIAYNNEYILRYLTQAITVLIGLHFMSDSETILKAFVSSYKVAGKSKFKHFLYDLGLKNALAVTFYTLCLLMVLLIPASSLLAVMLFTIGYYVDKYNLFFVYPIDFDSQYINRATLVV
jgi:hypothetical protein